MHFSTERVGYPYLSLLTYPMETAENMVWEIREIKFMCGSH